jgi:hypothetical protein
MAETRRPLTPTNRYSTAYVLSHAVTASKDTIKDWMGRIHFKTRTLEKVGTEMSLHVLAYNMKRAINMLGAPKMIAATRG